MQPSLLFGKKDGSLPVIIMAMVSTSFGYAFVHTQPSSPSIRPSEQLFPFPCKFFEHSRALERVPQSGRIEIEVT